MRLRSAILVYIASSRSDRVKRKKRKRRRVGRGGELTPGEENSRLKRKFWTPPLTHTNTPLPPNTHTNQKPKTKTRQKKSRAAGLKHIENDHWSLYNL